MPMLLSKPRGLASMLLIVAGGAVGGQELKVPDTPEILHLAPPPSDRFPLAWYPRVGDGTDVLPAPVTEHPYTAQSGTIEPQTGEIVGPATAGSQARDRSGRTRSEAESGGMLLDGQSVKLNTVLVSDPVSHCDFRWTQPAGEAKLPAGMRVAIVTCHPRTLRYKAIDSARLIVDSLPEGISHNGDTTSTVEHLPPVRMGSLTIHRLRVTNSRSDAQGQGKTSSTETWYSPELQEIVRLGNGQEGYTGLTNIQLVDPDPALFYPPDGYRIEVQAPQ